MTSTLAKKKFIKDKAEELAESLVDEDGIKQLEEITRPFRLSDAIREGSLVTGQKIGGWVDTNKGEACALSAALISATNRGLV